MKESYSEPILVSRNKTIYPYVDMNTYYIKQNDIKKIYIYEGESKKKHFKKYKKAYGKFLKKGKIRTTHELFQIPFNAINHLKINKNQRISFGSTIVLKK